jgi:hypothetical protein
VPAGQAERSETVVAARALNRQHGVVTVLVDDLDAVRRPRRRSRRTTSAALAAFGTRNTSSSERR